MKDWTKPFKAMGACMDAIDWCQLYDSLEDAWQVCKRGDWMLWLLEKVAGKPESKSRKLLVLTVCQCARLALPYVIEGDKRPLRVIETVEAWARGENGVTLDDMRHAYAYAAHAAVVAAYATYATDATDATYVAARLSALRHCADIVREFYPNAPKI